MTVETIIAETGEAVRALKLRTRLERYEAAKKELECRAEAAGCYLQPHALAHAANYATRIAGQRR